MVNIANALQAHSWHGWCLIYVPLPSPGSPSRPLTPRVTETQLQPQQVWRGRPLEGAASPAPRNVLTWSRDELGRGPAATKQLFIARLPCHGASRRGGAVGVRPRDASDSQSGAAASAAGCSPGRGLTMKIVPGRRRLLSREGRGTGRGFPTGGGRLCGTRRDGWAGGDRRPPWSGRS